MAELGAAFAISSAVLKLSKVLHEQARFLLYVKDDVEGLMKELSWMQSFLKDAENKLDRNHLIRQWVSDVRDVAYDCEDVMDIFLLELGGAQTQAGGCLGAISSCCISYTTNLCSTYKLSSRVKNLMTKVNDISSRRDRYDLNTDALSTSDSNNVDEKLMDLRRSAPYANNEHMVGLDETISLLTNELTNGCSGRFVISIIGMGGLGKTTLARKLYDKLRQQYFNFYAWICVSQEYDTSFLLRKLIKSIINPTKEDLEDLTTNDSMEAYLRNFLSGGRFLVVIDDLWEREAWESLKRAFPDNSKDSRVIITTRNKHVGHLNSAYVHELRYLQEDESWELFCNKAFPDDNAMPLSPHIEHLGKEMVAKCSGLPLAIVTLGGLLSTKPNTLNDWTLVRDNFWKELEKDSMHINALLLLSYKDLPYFLKPCFLYIAMFPEDFEIPISKLMLLWVAEGFIVSESGLPESVAKSYFNELVGRSLIQRKGEDWIGSTCRVHDLLRDLAIMKAKDICFSVYFDEQQIYNLPRAPSHRRLAVFCPSSTSLPSGYINPSLRTLRIGSTGKDCPQTHIPSDVVLQPVHMRFSLLRVVDIQVDYGDIFKPQELPKELGRLIHLRYLGLRLLKSAVKELPDTIGNLKLLQTLCVESDKTLTLPKTMEKLQNLRHLIGNFGLCDWIGKLNGLETLQEITYEQWCGIDTRNLVNLCHLSLTNVPQVEANPGRFYDKFRNIKRLQTLTLENPEVFELASISVSDIFKCCPCITHFKSSGIKFFNSSDWHEFAMKLQVLDIVCFNSPEVDPIPSIERLPALRALQMKYYSDGTRQLMCSGEGFPQLQTLIVELGHNVTLSVAESGMPLLTHLGTNTSDNLEVPRRLKDLIIKF